MIDLVSKLLLKLRAFADHSFIVEKRRKNLEIQIFGNCDQIIKNALYAFYIDSFEFLDKNLSTKHHCFVDYFLPFLDHYKVLSYFHRKRFSLGRHNDNGLRLLRNCIALFCCF